VAKPQDFSAESDSATSPDAAAAVSARPGSDELAAIYKDLRLTVEYVAIKSLRTYKRPLRARKKGHVDEIAASLKAFGLVQPILVDEADEIIGGEGILEAAERAGYAEVPVIRISHLDEPQKRTLRIALNRLAEKAGWNREMLSLEFQELIEIDCKLDLNFDLAVTGFSFPEIDQLIESTAGQSTPDADDDCPDLDRDEVVSRAGDLWLLGDHRLICGDAREPAVYAALLGDERAAMGIHDPPYDVRISGHVAKRGRHREFVMGSGELREGFTPFLSSFLTAAGAQLVPGGYQYCFMDFRHMREMLTAGEDAGLELKNLCVWNKGVGAMGSFYRSQHELVFVFKDPGGSGANNIQLGKFGRNRTNVWDYPGAVAMRKELELHPTPKSVRMIADAVRDASNRNDIVLDSFSGSGTTIIASAKVGRRGYAVELDPRYVDVGVKRWEKWSGGVARLAASGLTFAEVREERPSSSQEPGAVSEPDNSTLTVRLRTRPAAQGEQFQ
jgi:DNA modification methylase